MLKPSELDDWDARKDRIIGLGERSFRKSYYPQLRHNLDRLERFHTLLDHTPDFVVLLSLPDGVITDANAALGELLGESVDALIGRPFAALGVGDAATVLDALRSEMNLPGENGVPTPSHSVVTEFCYAGTLIWLEFSYRVAGVDGTSYGVLVGRDVTERQRNHEILAAPRCSPKRRRCWRTPWSASSWCASGASSRAIGASRRFSVIRRGIDDRPARPAGLYETDETFYRLR